VEYKEPKHKITIKDIILVGIFIVLISLNAFRHIQTNCLDNLDALITQTLILMLAFVGLIEIAYYIGWTIFVPDFFQTDKEKRMKSEIRDFMDEFFKNDINYISINHDEKIEYIMTQLGISRNQLDEIRHDIIKMRCLPLKSIVDAKEKLPADCNVLGFYCLITRKEWNGVKRLEDMRIKVNRIADINDEDIRKLRGE